MLLGFLWIGEVGGIGEGEKPFPSTTCITVSAPRLSSGIAASPDRIIASVRLVLSDNTGLVILGPRGSRFESETAQNWISL